MNNSDQKIFTDSPIHPGIYLKDTLESMDIPQTELSKRIGLSRKVINEIIGGRAPITPDSAVLFERALRIPARIWINLQKNYDLSVAYKAEEERISADLQHLKLFPVKRMIENGWLPSVSSKEDKIKALYNFFGITRLDNLNNSTAIQFRRSLRPNYSKEAIFVWLRKGELDIETLEVETFNKERALSLIPELRSLTILKPEIFQPRLVDICASVGIAVAFIPELPKTFINGAAFWENNSKAAILLSLRFKSNDHFWFSFFHELGHILLHGKKDSFVDIDENCLTEGQNEKEVEANRFAEETLIPRSYWEHLISDQPFSKSKIVAHAKQLKIAPGIIVGRLQREGYLPYSHLNALKVKFVWAK